jgi:serine/threonine protein kinase
MAALLPESFAEYELVDRLGVGGMAETFVAVRSGDGGFEQRVCLKRILPVFADEKDFVGMFLREARLSALLHHPHIARVLDFGIVADTHYLALELIEGIDLRALLRHFRMRAEGLPAGLTAYVGRALAGALDFAHTADSEGRVAGIVHRDVSPSNVLLSTAGEVKLADFGIAKAMSRPGSIQSAALKGKIPYMAPEYALGRRCSARSDLFSLGVVLYECLAGARPFDADNDMATLERARKGLRKPLETFVHDAPRALIEAVEMLIEPAPADRPANAGALLDLLEPVSEPPLAQRDLGHLVRSVERDGLSTSLPGLASTRAASATRRPRKPLPSRA